MRERGEGSRKCVSGQSRLITRAYLSKKPLALVSSVNLVKSFSISRLTAAFGEGSSLI
jgi:hypothetical protein